MNVTEEQYEPPTWARGMAPIPSAKLRLGLFPTPVQRFNLKALHDIEGLNVYIKRDGTDVFTRVADGLLFSLGIT